MNTKAIELLLVTRCAHCGKETNGKYPIGMQCTAIQTMLVFCSEVCHVCTVLDTLIRRIESHEVIDPSWIPVIKQIHDQIYTKAKGEGQDDH